MKLSINYCVSAAMVLRDPDAENKLAQMEKAGVGTLWLGGYFFGHMDAPLEDLAAARRRLMDQGFQVEVLHVPLGHGGNAMDPADDTIDLSIGQGWRSTVDREGRVCPNTTCIDEKVIADTRAVNDALLSMGFTRIFYDDDLRLGQWGPAVQGCFCDRCLGEFGEAVGRAVSRHELAQGTDPALLEAWMDFSCGKITGYLRGVTPPGAIPGVMVMHNGDRRHGVDIAAIAAALPGALFRVGEGHFGDAAWTHPMARASILASIHTHIARAGDASRCYSESTIFPMGALTPEHWLAKIRLEIAAGLRNLFLMGGTQFIWPPYWAALAAALPELSDLAARTPEPEHRETEFIWQI